MCGVVGVVLPSRGHEAAAVAATALFALQHRGQESAGVGVSDGTHLMIYKDLGMVGQVLDERRIPSLAGDLAVAHCRYSTTGLHGLGERPADAPPGAAPRARHRPQRQPRQHARAARPAPGRARTAPREHRHGAPDRAAGGRAGRGHGRRPAPGPAPRPRGVQPRDPRRGPRHRRARPARVPAARPGPPPDAGRREAPGLWGDDTGGWIMASETAALDIVGAEYVRDVEPGEIVVLEPGRAPVSVRYAEATPALCVFELIYFARPDSYMEGVNLYEARRRMGMQLAARAPGRCADLVMPVPDTGAPAAAGYAEASGIPYREGLVRNRYSGRTFIQPSQAMRQRGVNVKLSPLREIIRDKRLIVVDDSIVRGTTTKQIVGLLRRGRRGRGPRPDQRPADLPPVLLRHRHLDRDRADRRDPLGGGDPRVHRCGLARVPVRERGPRGAGPPVRPVLLRLLRRQLPGAGPVRRGGPQVHARDARGGRGERGRGAGRLRALRRGRGGGRACRGAHARVGGLDAPAGGPGRARRVRVAPSRSRPGTGSPSSSRPRTGWGPRPRSRRRWAGSTRSGSTSWRCARTMSPAPVPSHWRSSTTSRSGGWTRSGSRRWSPGSPRAAGRPAARSRAARPPSTRG